MSPPICGHLPGICVYQHCWMRWNTLTAMILIHSAEVGLHPILLHVIISATSLSNTHLCALSRFHNLRERGDTRQFFPCSSDTLHVWNISTGESLTNRKLAVFLQRDNTQYITAGNPVIPKLCELLHLAPAPGERLHGRFPPAAIYSQKMDMRPLTAHSLLCYLLSPVPLESAPALQGTLIFNWIYLYWKAPHACKPLSY